MILLEQLNDEVAIYFVDMKSGNTTVQRATEDEMQEMYESGVGCNAEELKKIANV